MVKTECSVVRDLLPLYVEDLVSPETARYVTSHLAECPACQKELDSLRAGGGLTAIEKEPPTSTKEATSFKAIMKRLNRQFDSIAYAALVCLIFLGFGWTGGENLMYNSLVMPVAGVFGYYVFRWKAVYKVPILLLIIDTVVCLFKLVDLDLYGALLWTGIYSIFVFVGIAIAFLLHFAFRKEKNK